jgi:gas vesicle protein
MANDAQGGSGFSWFLAGLGIGSLLGVLYAPKAGQDTREELVANALGSREYLRDRSREAGRAAGDYVERGKGQVNNYVSKSKEAVEIGRQKVNEAYNQGRQTVLGKKEKLSAAYEAGKHAYEETSVKIPSEELFPSSEHSS